MLIRFVAATAALLITTPVFAATLTINPILATWQNVVADNPPGLTFSGNGTANASVRWTQSGYDFNAAAVPLNVAFVANGVSTAFSLGNFSHVNQPVFESITSAQLKITYGLFLDGSALGNFDSFLDFAHDETSNGTNPCSYGGANLQGVNINGCADRVVTSLNLGNTQSFTVGGVQYVLNVTGFAVGGVPASEFLTTEQAVNTAQLNGTISARSLVNAVPEPATWAMMIGGFGMVGGSMRYRRRKTSVSFS